MVATQWPEKCWCLKVHFSFFMSHQAYGLVRFRHKKHLVRVRTHGVGGADGVRVYSELEGYP